MNPTMTPNKFCELVENRLGYVSPIGHKVQHWHRHSTTATKLTKAMAEKPRLYTWDNLVLTVEMLRRERRSCSPLGVLHHVERAIHLAHVPDSQIDTDIRQAIEIENWRGNPDGWVERLIRATGRHRASVLDEYRAAVTPAAS